MSDDELMLAYLRIDLGELRGDLTGGTLDAGQEETCRTMVAEVEARIRELEGRLEVPEPDVIVGPQPVG